MTKRLCLLVAIVACAALNALCAADAPLPPLFKNLGRHHHPVTTKYEMAQRYFDQGLTLCFNFNHAEAVRSFEAAAAIDPQCALEKKTSRLMTSGNASGKPGAIPTSNST